ncbi:MAG: beta-ketoacyl-ACP synthase III [Chloroflexota bacterium]
MASSNGNGHRPSENGRNGRSPAKPGPKPARYAHITGWGMAVPERVMTNDDLARIVDTNDEWIQSRTGIKQRRIADSKETTTSLAILAARRALEVADLSPEDIGLIIVATCTPEYAFPSTAALVQDAIGATKAGAFDLSAACTGFIYAVNMAADAIKCGSAKAVLVIGAETLSRVVDWEDRGTCVLFGDGAGAFVLQGSETPGGVLSGMMRSDGSGGSSLSLASSGYIRPAGVGPVLNHKIQMNGREVFRFATRVMNSITREVVADAGLTLEDINLIIPHQANRRIIEAAARGLELPEDKFFINVDRYGNTSTASIPIAVCEAVSRKKVRPNDHLVLVGFGGGLTWGAVAIHWEVTPPPEISRWNQLGRQLRYGLARINSMGRRALRRVEGALFGSQAPEGVEPPHRGRKK